MRHATEDNVTYCRYVFRKLRGKRQTLEIYKVTYFCPLTHLIMKLNSTLLAPRSEGLFHVELISARRKAIFLSGGDRQVTKLQRCVNTGRGQQMELGRAGGTSRTIPLTKGGHHQCHYKKVRASENTTAL